MGKKLARVAAEADRESARREAAAHMRRASSLKRICDAQAESIERFRQAKFSFKKQRSCKAGKISVRFIIPDTHGSLIDQSAAAAMFSDLERFGKQVSEVILLGDHLECGGFLAQHHVLGYVAQSEYTFEQDVVAANVFLDRIQSIVPKAKIYYLEGNHENRIERWIVDQVVGNSADKAFLNRMFSTSSVLSLENRGIEFIHSGKFYCGLAVPGAIKLGKCYFLHGSNHGVNVARVMAGQFGGNVVFGHVHTPQYQQIRTVSAGQVIATCPGCLCQIQPLWRHSSITSWGYGYAYQIVRDNGLFLHQNVPVVDGESMLGGFFDLF